MIEKISETELEFMETLYNPLALGESLFSNFDNLSLYTDDEFGYVRVGQLPMMSFEYLLDNDPDLSEKENFKLREGAGNCWALGGRKFGKTMIVEKIDLLVSMVLLDGEKVGFCSYDAIHIRGILDEVFLVLENHPFYDLIFHPKANKSPNYHAWLKNGYDLISVNMNIQSKNPGAQFFQKHLNRLYIEEASFETEEVYKKRLDAVSENGCVLRIAGMTNFTKYSPCGLVFYDLAKKPWVCNLPQYVNPKWDDKEKERAIKDHGGESSITYRVFVKGEVVEEGISVFDMERVRHSYNEEKVTKTFEVTKDKFDRFESLLIIERPSNATNCFICSDIGESAPSELIVLFEINGKYHYVYNITLYNLTDKQQEKVFKFIIEKCKANIIGIDTTDGTGRAIFRSLEIAYGREHMVWVAFNEKLPVALEKDEKTNSVIYKDGKPVYKEEYVLEWSIKHLKELLYDGKMVIPLDYKLDTQLNSVVSVQSGTRTIYECIAQENHLFQAFQVFSIAHWNTEFKNIVPIETKRFFKSGV